MYMDIKTYPILDRGDDVSLTAYVAMCDEELPYNRCRPGVLVCPGGGYAFCSSREAEPIALSLLASGYNAFVLNYSCNDYGTNSGRKYPAQLLEAAESMRIIKRDAELLRTDPERIFVIGFSAGGHLAASLGILHSSEEVCSAFPNEEKGFARPKGMILSYPVITSGNLAHGGSIRNLLLDSYAEQENIEKVSLEKRVGDDCAPAFIWHTRDDSCVPVENSLLLANALAAHKIDFEMHIYPHGSHGASLGTPVVGCNNPVLSSWFADAVRWMGGVK